jgi:DnaJ family protein A protein 2
MRQIGPGMMQQARVACDRCNGRGTNLSEKDKCKMCRGERTKTGEESLSVVIEKGMEHNMQIPFAGEGDQDPEIDVPGDIVIVLQQLKHDTLTRDDNDLHMKKSLTLAEAMCGFQFIITQLDKRVLVVRSEPGQMIKPGDKKCIKGEGMPVHMSPGKFGDLVIEFEVTFPERLEDSAMEILRTALPPPAAADNNFDGEDTEECYVSRQPLDEMRKEMENQDDDGDEEGGGGGGGQGVQCAQQ